MWFDRQDFRQFPGVSATIVAVATSAGEASAELRSASWAADGPAAGQFGLLLRRLRQASGLTQEELAARSGLSVRAIADAESGRTRRLHRHSAEQIAAALSLTEFRQADFVAAARGQHAATQPRSEPAASELPTMPATLAGRVIPRELPGAAGHFTGRQAELSALTRLLEQDEAGTVVISAIGGTAGVGKTALAIRWAHQAADRFPDGQLYANLRGYDPDQPVAAADALAGFLRSLGVPGPEIPDEMEDRARLYRSRLAGRRILVLLDNARDSEQARSLLPGDPGCVAIVTSRDTLAGLVAASGARRLDLDVLPGADAVALLRSLIGSRVDDDPGVAAALAGLCARLPLALRIAAELAVARPAATLRELVAELEATHLDGLNAGEDRTDVRTVLAWSYCQLRPDTAEAFALTGLHPGQDFDILAAAALTGTTAARVRTMLSQLVRGSLLQAIGSGRYGMHDLLRAYAREQAGARDTGSGYRHALTRLFDYYLAAAAAAMDVLFPAEAHLRPRTSAADAVLPAMPGHKEARAWLDGERANLVSAVAYCAAHGWPGHATGLADTLFRYLISGSHLTEAETIYGHALQAAQGVGDLAAEARALSGLGSCAVEKGRFGDAAGHYQAALERYRQCGDRDGQARVLHNLGVTAHQLHNYQSAAGYYREAIAAFRVVGNRLSVAAALCSLSGVEVEMGSYARAAEQLESALEVFRDENDLVREAEALSRMGELSLRRGQLTQAASLFEQALTAYRTTGQVGGIASELKLLGDVSLRQGEFPQAITYLRQALALFRQTGYQHGEVLTLRTLAEALDAAGQSAGARAELEAALQLAAETGNTYQQASAHADLAESHHAGGQNERARFHWERALDLYIQLGAPEADQVASRLSAYHAT